jgi:hypothetical protein
MKMEDPKKLMKCWIIGHSDLQTERKRNERRKRVRKITERKTESWITLLGEIKHLIHLTPNQDYVNKTCTEIHNSLEITAK